MLSLWTRGVRGALQRLTGGSARLAGQDSLGNKYYAAEEAHEVKGMGRLLWNPSFVYGSSHQRL